MSSPSVPPGLGVQEEKPFAEIGYERRCSLIDPVSLEGYKKMRTFLKKRGVLVELVKLTSGKNVVLKTQSLDYYDGINSNEIGEVDNLARLRGVPNIVQLEGVCFKEDKMIIVAEPLSGSLRDLTKILSSNDRLIHANNLMYSMIYVLALFESADIYHFDIKPLNILYNFRFNIRPPKPGEARFEDKTLQKDDRYIFKMSDFGGARTQVSLADMSQLTLTLGYISPELIVRRPSSQFDPHQSDLWALGITVLEFIIGHHVYIAHNKEDYLGKMYEKSNITDPTKRGYVAPEDFHRINKEGLFIDEGLNVDEILTEHLYSDQKVDQTVVKILKELLKFNPTSRRHARQLLSTYYGENVDNVILESLTPKEFPRRVYPEGIKTIRDLMNDKKGYDDDLTDVPTLIAIELYTRFLGLLSQEDYDRLTKEDLQDAAIVSLRLALKYVHEDFGLDLSDVDFGYSISSSESNEEEEEEEIYEDEDSSEEGGLTKHKRILNYEKIILLTVDFLVYNLNLSPYVDVINELSFDVDPQQYLNPISEWFNE